MATVRRLQEANQRRLPLQQYLSAPLHRLVNCHADAIGAPVEFIFYPLLTAVASCMGVNSHIRINPTWTEPSILWFVVAAKKGEKKTAALRVLRKPLERIQREMVESWEADIADDKPKTPPQLLVDNFSFEELHSIMKRNGHQMMGMFDEMSSFYAQLDLFKHAGTYTYAWPVHTYFCRACNTHKCCCSGSDFGRKTFITLNGGDLGQGTSAATQQPCLRQLSISLVKGNLLTFSFSYT